MTSFAKYCMFSVGRHLVGIQTTETTRPRNIRHQSTSNIKPHVTMYLSIPTTWHRNPLTIDMVNIMYYFLC